MTDAEFNTALRAAADKRVLAVVSLQREQPDTEQFTDLAYDRKLKVIDAEYYAELRRLLGLRDATLESAQAEPECGCGSY